MALIKCPKCENEISDQCGVCPHCGEIITRSEVTKAETSDFGKTAAEASSSQQGENKKKKSPWTIIGMGIGIIAIVVGMIIVFLSSKTLDYASFGGDFYTYTYRGIRAVEGAICTLTKAVGALIAVIGAVSVCTFGSKL